MFRFAPDSTATTLLGWSPGLKALVGGKVLLCGCLVGTYHTWRGGTVVILDARSPRCTQERHRPHVVLWASHAPALHEQPQLDEVTTDAGLA